MDESIDAILYSMPVDAPDYADNLLELDREDIPYDRVPQIVQIMHSNKDAYTVLRAATLLAYWGVEDGFKYLASFVCDREPSKEVLMPHRLRNYDDTYTQVLMAFKRYWAMRADLGEGEEVRRALYSPILKIIELSNNNPFEIVQFFWLVVEEGFVEYIPALKHHLLSILKDPDLHHWKIADCAHLLMKFDATFVDQALAQYGKTLADFPNK